MIYLTLSLCVSVSLVLFASVSLSSLSSSPSLPRTHLYKPATNAALHLCRASLRKVRQYELIPNSEYSRRSAHL